MIRLILFFPSPEEISLRLNSKADRKQVSG